MVEPTGYNTTRRGIIAGASTAALITLSGCAGDDDPPEEGIDTDDDDGVDDGIDEDIPILGAMEPPKEFDQLQAHNYWGRNWNNGPASPIHEGFPIYSTTAEFITSEEEYNHDMLHPIGFESVELDGDNIVFNLPDENWQWSSGDDVASDDVELYLKLSSHLSGIPVYDDVEQIYTEDDRTTVVETDSEINTEYVMILITEGTNDYLNTPTTIEGEESIYVDWIERLEDVTTEDERAEIDEEIYDYDHTEVELSETVCSGRFEIEEYTSSEMLFTPREGHYDTPDYSIRYETVEAVEGVTAVLDDAMDIARDPAPEHVEGFDEGEVVVRQGDDIQGLVLNSDTSRDDVPEVFANPSFRQGVAYILDREDIAAVSPYRASATTYADSIEYGRDEALPNIGSELELYHQDHDRAEELFYEAGLSYEDGTWYLPNGDLLELDFISPEWHHWPDLGEATSAQLMEFGIEVEHRVSQETWDQGLWGEGEFQTTRNHHNILTPIGAFEEVFGENNDFNVPETLEIPPILEWDGEPEEVNVRDEVEVLRTSGGDEYVEAAEQLAWAFNYYLPFIPTNVENGPNIYRETNFEFPDREDPIWGVETVIRFMSSLGSYTPR